jgi:hypothetical protein
MKRLIIVLCMVVLLMANSKTTGQSDREFQLKVHDINQVEMTISNFGKFGQSEYGVGCWWPKGSNQNYIYGAGIWFGTIANGDTLVTIGYGPHGGESEFVPGLQGMSFSDPNAIIFMFPDLWPPPADTFPMAPQDHISHQDSWCCFNDCDSTYHMPGDTRPIGIEVYQTVYAWDVSEIEDIIFFTYEVKNVSGHTLYDCYIGVVTDSDIGNEVGGSANDQMAGIVGRWYVIDEESLWVDNLGYQWQEEEEALWDDFPGVIGFDLLQTPSDIGMTALKRFTLLFEPDIDAERYSVLAGYNFMTGIYEPYDTLPSDPDDQRFLMSSGPFDLEPDESATMIFAVLFANWYSIYDTPDTALVLVDKWAQYQYDSGWQLSIEESIFPEVSKTSVALNPNPCAGNTKISFSLAQPGLVSIKLYNSIGQLVYKIMQSTMSTGTYTFDIDTRELSQGNYFLILETPDGKTSRSVVVLH